MVSFKAEDVLAMCQKYSQMIKTPPGVNAYGVMAGIASVESSMGANCGPRYEMTYDQGGSVWHTSKSQRILVEKFGRAAACSYGPWQMMFDNYREENPQRLETDLELNAQEFAIFFEHYVINFRRAATLSEIAEIWNLGHIAPDPEYEAKLSRAYQRIMTSNMPGGVAA